MGKERTCIGAVAISAITDAANSCAVSFITSLEDSAGAEIVAGAAAAGMEVRVGCQITSGVVAGFTGAVVCCQDLAYVGVNLVRIMGPERKW